MHLFRLSTFFFILTTCLIFIPTQLNALFDLMREKSEDSSDSPLESKDIPTKHIPTPPFHPAARWKNQYYNPYSTSFIKHDPYFREELSSESNK